MVDSRHADDLGEHNNKVRACGYEVTMLRAQNELVDVQV